MRGDRRARALRRKLTARTRGQTRRVANLTRLFASYLVEQYTDAARMRAEVRGGLPIRHLHKVEDYVSAQLAQEIFVAVTDAKRRPGFQTLASLVELSPSHFSRDLSLSNEKRGVASLRRSAK